MKNNPARNQSRIMAKLESLPIQKRLIVMGAISSFAVVVFDLITLFGQIAIKPVGKTEIRTEKVAALALKLELFPQRSNIYILSTPSTAS